MNANTFEKPSTLADLMRVEGQAELIRGRIIEIEPAGARPATVTGNIFFALHSYARSHGGRAHMSKVGHAVPKLSSGRESSCADASYHSGPRVGDSMDFISGSPRFAVEVRSRRDYQPGAEEERQSKRIDYFEAGTLAVWDVDILAFEIVLYVPSQTPPLAIFRKGEMAHAEPAVSGWSIAVDEVFED